MLHHFGLSWMIVTKDKYNFAVGKIMRNGVHEDHGLMRQFFKIFMAFYLRNYLLQQIRIDMILSVDYMITTNVKKSANATDFYGGRPLPEYSNLNPLISLCVTINFNGT